ncbi:MAG: FixH family protein [Capnocytophaga sp.]|nr:FixH family protein [Capnocytophaga sp.]
MKIKIIIGILSIFTILSCGKDNDGGMPEPINNFKEAAKFVNDGHTIIVSTDSGKFYSGYNQISISIADNQGNKISPETVTQFPEMSMLGADGTVTHKHSCPHTSELEKAEDYTGYIVFQMFTKSDTGFWDLKLSYTAGGKSYEATQRIDVLEQKNTNLAVKPFTATDGKRYILALISPEKPKLGSNELIAGLFKMESMNSFPIAEGFTLKLDPRMPGMGNHSSPNNIDLTQDFNGFYKGSVNYSMTGDWTLNFIMQDKEKAVIKGTEITGSNEKSDLHFDVIVE